MMRQLPAWVLVLGLGMICATSTSFAGEQTAQSTEVKTKIHYLLSLPEGYDDDKDKRWPLIIFLHGAGERGDNLDLVKVHGPPKLVQAGKKMPFIVVSPQCPQDEWWNVKLLSAMLDDLQSKHRIDNSRIYLTGLSMGGFGTWDWASREPNRFAAIVPICGGGSPFFARRIKDIPTWVFHGAKDSAVPLAASEAMVKALEEAGGKPKFTVYPDLEHDSWTVTYDNPELYKWLLEHQLPEAKVKK